MKLRGRPGQPKSSNFDLEPRFTLENIPTAALVVDHLGRVLDSNQRAGLLLELHEQTLRGMNMVELIGRDLIGRSIDVAAPAMTVVLQLPSRRRVSVMVSVSTLPETEGSTRTIVVLTPTKSAGSAAADVVPRVAPWIEVAERVAALEGEALCVAIGVVGLQAVNESFSRSTGDVVLTEIGRRLGGVSPAHSVIERIAGNRFVIVTTAEVDPNRTVGLLVSAVREPIETPLGTAAVGCAVGVTIGPARPPLVLVDRADRNLDIALRRGAGSIEWNDQAPLATLPKGARLGAPLLASIAAGTISAHFQPVIELSTGRIVEYEALARWEHEHVTSHAASQFIEVAKDTGAIIELGAIVLQDAIALCTVLRATGDPALTPRVSVNVSDSELCQPGLAALVLSKLADAALAPGALQIELTDNIGTDHGDSRPMNIQSLRGAGVRVVIDGFGSRGANLLTLRDFAVDAIKLDPAISLGVDQGSRGASVLRSILALAKEMGVDVVAKGVETLAQHQLLVGMGCKFGQGLLYQAPRPALALDLSSGATVAMPASDNELVAEPVKRVRKKKA